MGNLFFKVKGGQTWRKSCSGLYVIKYSNSITLIMPVRHDWPVLLYVATLGQHKASILSIRVHYFPKAVLQGPIWFLVPVKNISGIALWPLALFKIIWVSIQSFLLPEHVQINSHGFWISHPVSCPLTVKVAGLWTMFLCHHEPEYDRVGSRKLSQGLCFTHILSQQEFKYLLLSWSLCPAIRSVPYLLTPADSSVLLSKIWEYRFRVTHRIH